MMEKRGKYKKICGIKVTKKLGLAKNKLYTMRWSNPEAFEYMLKFGDDTVTAYRRYLEHKDNVRNRACEIIYWLEEHRLKRAFGKFLAEKKVYKNYESFNSASYRVLFSERGIVHHSTLLIFEKVNELFDEFLETVNIKIEVGK